ncbi:MAG: hypothetical protein FWE46_06065 [Coriobacteriia bacterium]|nr:hypothetical protein [Coriobacteriia bacterium]
MISSLLNGSRLKRSILGLVALTLAISCAVGTALFMYKVLSVPEATASEAALTEVPAAEMDSAGMEGAEITESAIDGLASDAVDDIVPFEVILYKIFRSPDGYAALIGGGISEDIPLPARFEIAVPAGVDILWFGEISGGPRDQDRTFDEPFEVHREGDLDIYTAVTNEHVVQLEYLIPGEPFEALGGGNHLYRLSYTPMQDARILRLAAYLPTGSVVTDPAFVRLGEAAQTEEPLYGITFFDVTGGETYEATLEYGPPASIARQGQGNLGGGILATMGILAVVVAALGASFYLAKKRRAQTADAEEDHEVPEED